MRQGILVLILGVWVVNKPYFEENQHFECSKYGLFWTGMPLGILLGLHSLILCIDDSDCSLSKKPCLRYYVLHI